MYKHIYNDVYLTEKGRQHSLERQMREISKEEITKIYSK